MSWLWAWQRIQQLIGAVLAAGAGGAFLWLLAYGELGPLVRKADVGQTGRISISDLDDPGLDHGHIATAIGACRWSGSPKSWSSRQLAVLRLNSVDPEMDGPVSDGATLKATSQAPNDREPDYVLTPFEQAAIYQSNRVMNERQHYVADADKRQARLRWHQVTILLVSAAAAFLVGLKTLVMNKDTDLAFRSLVAGAVFPISIFALLMPVIGTALSGVIAFDDDASAAVRDVRTVAQLEQLHGRIGQDVIGDPHLCQLYQLAAEKRVQKVGSSDVLTVGSIERVKRFDACLQDRFARTVAWEQRHEQILNDANQTLAHAGNLPLGSGPPKPTATAAANVDGDPCDAAFRPEFTNQGASVVAAH
ncbi:MAG TPA: hypothetical protein VL614_23430 [Acetobacteraceae bacterium]|jgi:hypothetical protein|nr:hypothetical protein [Acetobacteraceae bacterium]